MKVSPIEVVVRRLVVAACVACAVAATPAAAAGAAPRAAAPARHRAVARAHRSASHRAPAMRAVVDPATGRIASSPRLSDAPGAPALAPTAAPAPAASGAAASPVVRTLADGTQIVAVPADQMQYEVVRVGKDGKLVRSCVHGDPAAAHLPVKPLREEQ